MNDFFSENTSSRVWPVGALCRAIADALQARFNPVRVTGELSGFTLAASGHCYFSLKDANGQLRCAMFKRAAVGLNFSPRDGDHVEVQGRLGVYEPRGELQLVVEDMRRAGQGSLFEQFMQLKARLEQEGLFAQHGKRPLPVMPRGIGLVTSLGAAALQDVIATLRRRVAHIPVTMVAASVQGENAPRELQKALQTLYAVCTAPTANTGHIDVILLVRGGGSIEDLWAFNDEALARLIRQSPVPVISGVGHETDFTIADFVADVRAPTPTAAAELVAQPTQAWLSATQLLETRLHDATLRQLDRQTQRLDWIANSLSKPSQRLAQQRLRLESMGQRMAHCAHAQIRAGQQEVSRAQGTFPATMQRSLQQLADRSARAALRLELLDPTLVLQRGYAWLTLPNGRTLDSVHHAQPGQAVAATLADGVVDLHVTGRRHN